ncbi:hypothetical protein [Halorientalis persicus]|uniref:hypothetical protein n=1 Tax=Halorientalis persicus TaxID=1367881 RepID=UPI001FCCD3BE|nr:hypothetical protein [Halorientalis persicus]
MSLGLAAVLVLLAAQPAVAGAEPTATPSDSDSEPTGAGAFGFILVLFGLPGTVRPYGTARFSERLDAIGSDRRLEEVEPSDWMVLLTRIVSVAMVLFGGFLILLAALG